METKLARIADKSRNEKRPIFTSLYHLINEELLKQCHKELDGSKAVGIDNVSKKKFRQKVKAMKVWIYQNRDIKVSELMEQIKIKLIGHYRYYGISHNGRMISCFRQRTIDFLLKLYFYYP